MSNNQSEEGIIKTSLIGNYAGFVTRLIAFTIDILAVSAVIMFATWFISTTLEILQVNLFLKTFTHSNLSELISLNYRFVPVIASIISLVFTVGYHVFFWYTVGQTPGKAVMGIRIVSLRGEKLSFWRALLRYFGYMLSGIALGLGFLWILIDDRRMGWHDKIANTCVIYVWDAHPDESFLKQARQQFTSGGKRIEEFTKKQQRGYD